MRSFEIQIFEIATRKDRRAKPWRVRWSVSGKRFEELFRTKALANSFRSELTRAANAGEPFATDTGLPISEARARNTTNCYELTRGYVQRKWPHLAAKSRRSTVEALTTITSTLVKPTQKNHPDAGTLREALYLYGLNPRRWDSGMSDHHQAALEWIERASLPVVELQDLDRIRRTLDKLCLCLDGRPAAATTARRKRAIFYNFLGYAVERGFLDSNPIDRIQWTAPAVAEAIDRRVVANPLQVAALLEAVTSLGLRAQQWKAFYACIYYAGSRPSEAANLHLADCHLPGQCLACGKHFANLVDIAPPSTCTHETIEYKWGRIIFTETEPLAGTHWTDDGLPHQRRGLKHRARKDTRPVPIPPRLVALIVEHVRRHGTAPDGRLFRGLHGGPASASVYDRWWKLARRKALTPEQEASPLARRVYDLRHAAASLWLNAGVPATEVARRLGHSVATLLRVYANCIDGGEDGLNQRISDALN